MRRSALWKAVDVEGGLSWEDVKKKKKERGDGRLICYLTAEVKTAAKQIVDCECRGPPKLLS
jgi:hypothetical protein